MATEGLHQPVGVRGPDPDGRYEIVWGHRRYLAARLLRWPTLSARLFSPDFDPLLAAVSENLQRADLNPLEEAGAVLRFIERGQPVAAVARLFRRSDAWVRERLALLDLPGELQECITARALPLAVVKILSEIDHADYRRELIKEAVRVGATAATAEVWRAQFLCDRERIITNQLTVEEIASRREAWVIKIACELCHDEVAYTATQSVRWCAPCLAEVMRLVEAAARAAAPA